MRFEEAPRRGVDADAEAVRRVDRLVVAEHGLDGDFAAAVAAAVAQTGAKGAADMGKLMAVLKPQLAGKADMTEVSKLVKAALAA